MRGLHKEVLAPLPLAGNRVFDTRIEKLTQLRKRLKLSRDSARKAWKYDDSVIMQVDGTIPT